MDKTRLTREAYERTALLITEFNQGDIIATSNDDDELETLEGREVMQTH